MSPRPVLLATLALLCPASGRAEPCPGNARASRLVERGDALFARSSTPRQAWQAIWMVEQALKAAPACYEASWRRARGYAWVFELDQDRGGNPAAGQRSHEAGLHAIQLNPRRVEGHYWAALGIGEHGRGMGVLRAIRQGVHGTFKRHLEAAQRIDRAYDDGGVDRVLAIYYRAIPWPLRDRKRSLEHFERSLRYSPRHPRTLLYLADALAADGRRDEAIARLRLCASIRDGEGSPRINRHYLWRCRRRLQELAR
jgi:tetratricopeptide (TPR) repeat protein